MNTLILTVGLPRSGKTTWARQTGFPVVSPDAIRLATHGRRFWAPGEALVWGMAWTMATALFIAGNETVIVDACHTSRKRRDFWRSPDMGDPPEWPSWVIRHKVFAASCGACIERAVDRQDFDLVKVIKRMADETEWPTEDFWEEPTL